MFCRQRLRRRLAPFICALMLLTLLMNTIGTPHLYAASYKVSLQPLAPIPSVSKPQSDYDVIVAGTDPEGVTAAVSAARNGLKVLLVEPRQKRTILGGLMTLGWLNSLDNNKAPLINSKYPSPYLNQGIFDEWYRLIEGTSFDVNRAASAFQKLVQNEKNIDVLMNVKSLEPIMYDLKVAGMRIVNADNSSYDVRSGAVIDATQDADIAALAGAPFTMGREDIGEPEARMAVTLVIKLGGVTDKVWNELKKYPGVGSDARSIWGYSEAREYPSSNPTRVKMRGLNIGRQDDNTILINSMQIYGIDPLDPASVREGMQIGAKEAPLIVDYLKQNFKPFASLKYVGVAPELYVRESRHLIGEYRLRMTDLMENRNFWDAIAYGSYEVDIQSLSATAGGAVMMLPEQYGVPFRTLVPKNIDGLLVVGRSASFDSLPHGSARVIPLGMATGQAAGAAVKLAQERNMNFRQLSRSWSAITELRSRLTKQGMDLRMRPFAKPEYASHPDYAGLLAATSLSLTAGGYKNDAWKLDGPASSVLLLNSVHRLQKIYPSYFGTNIDDLLPLDKEQPPGPLSLEQTAYILAMAMGFETASDTALASLSNGSWIGAHTLKNIDDAKQLTRGELFTIINDVLGNFGITFK
ncbi:FAD-dependent oxidoreductase [Cohnella panacarvi]|uniref:FAD-dependent oxidoreductase n=1 Tax=Cohnella panacarvi TaxID=400776 RepID=UPI00047CE875|nr:FAD-dependent oxidoreductase [Cohnella panacarvi]